MRTVWRWYRHYVEKRFIDKKDVRAKKDIRYGDILEDPSKVPISNVIEIQEEGHQGLVSTESILSKSRVYNDGRKTDLRNPIIGTRKRNNRKTVQGFLSSFTGKCIISPI